MSNEKKGTTTTTWQEPRMYAGYLRNVQRFYDREPLIQVSVQLILSIFTVAFFVFFAIRPTLGTISTLLKKIEDMEEASLKLDTKIAQLAQAQEILSESGPELKRLGLIAVPVTPEVDRLSKQIEVIANENNVYITSLEFQASPLVGGRSSLVNTTNRGVESGGGNFVTFSFAIGGAQEGVVGFFEDIESLDRVVLLTQAGFSVPESSYKKTFFLAASGKATVYYLPE